LILELLRNPFFILKAERIGGIRGEKRKGEQDLGLCTVYASHFNGASYSQPKLRGAPVACYDYREKEAPTKIVMAIGSKDATETKSLGVQHHLRRPPYFNVAAHGQTEVGRLVWTSLLLIASSIFWYDLTMFEPERQLE